MTLEQAKVLNYSNEIHHNHYTQNKGITCETWRVTGKVKIWKRSLERVKVPITHGLCFHGYLTEKNLEFFHLKSDCQRR